MSLKLSILSVKVPKYLKLDTTSTGSLFTLTGTNTFFCFPWILTNSFVLPAFISKKLSSHHSFKSEREKYVARSLCLTVIQQVPRHQQVTAVCKFIWLVYYRKQHNLRCPRIQVSTAQGLSWCANQSFKQYMKCYIYIKCVCVYVCVTVPQCVCDTVLIAVCGTLIVFTSMWFYYFMMTSQLFYIYNYY